MRREPLRVAVVSPTPLICAGLSHLLDSPHVEVHVDAAAPAGHHDNLADGHAVGHDVAIYDLVGLVEGPRDGLRRLLRTGIPVLGLELPTRPDLVDRARAMGVTHVISPDITRSRLLAILQRTAAAASGSRVEPQGLDLHELRTTTGLSERELEILTLIGTGIRNDEIAARLYLSINSIKTYIRTSYRKIGVQSRSQAVLWVYAHDLHPFD